MAINIVEEPDEWIEEWKHQVNENTEYDEKGAGWGVDFNGDFVFEVEPEGPLEEPLYFFVELYDGEVGEVHVTDDPESEDYGFVYRGPYGNWKKMTQGEIGSIDGLMSGQFELDGDMQRVLQYSEAAALLTEASTLVDTEFPEE